MRPSGSISASPSSSTASSGPRASPSVVTTTPWVTRRPATTMVPTKGSPRRSRSVAPSTPVSCRPCRTTRPKRPRRRQLTRLPNTWSFVSASVSGRAGLEAILNSQSVIDADAVGVQEHHFIECA
eukprot:8804017-Pyramimonas_sp.AAC.1